MDGHYLMHDSALEEINKPNNNKFSSCSKDQMWRIIEAQGGCFKQSLGILRDFNYLVVLAHKSDYILFSETRVLRIFHKK